MSKHRRHNDEGLSSVNLLWWAGYFVVAIWLQKLVPGLDAFVPALIICLMDGSKQQTGLFLLSCMIIQEGTGTLPFGASIIWYSVVIIMYYIGGWFFMGGNFMFIVMLSLAIGLSQALIFWGMGLLQPLPLDYQSMYHTYVLQALLTPVIWGIAWKTRSFFAVKNAY